MATEYKCDICGKPATVHITKIIDGKKAKIHLCAECAEKASFDAMNLPAQFLPKIQELEQEIISSKTNNKSGTCPTCGASLSEIENGARFSCPDCYKAMGGKLFEMLAQMHSATRHIGKTPKTHKVESLSKSVEKALKKTEMAVDDACGDILAGAELIASKVASKTAKDDALEISAKKISAQSLKSALEPITKESLTIALDKAIAEERYEDAAKLRDKIKEIS